MTRPSALAPLGLLVIVGGSIGVMVNLAKLAIEAGLAPATFLFWAVLGGGLILTAVALLSRQPPPLDRRGIEYALASGLLSIAVPNLLLFSAVSHVGAGFVAVSFAFPPLYTYLMALLCKIERPLAARALGVAAGIAGVVVLSWSKSVEPDASLGWIVVTLLAPVVVALGNIYRTLRWPAGATPLSLAPGMLLGSALWILLAVPLAGLPLGLPPGHGVGVALVIAQALSFAGMYALYFVLQRMAGPVYLSQIGAAGAIIGTAIAVFLLGESVPPGLAPAAVLIALGVALVTFGARLQARGRGR